MKKIVALRTTVFACLLPIFGAGICNATAIDSVACPNKTWDLNKINDYMTIGQASPATSNSPQQILRCFHRGAHDGINGWPYVPENSADAIYIAFNNAPCVEVDLGITGAADPYQVELIHDYKSWRSTWQVTVGGENFVNSTLAYAGFYGTGPTAPSAAQVYSPTGAGDNYNFTDVTFAYLRSGMANVSTPSTDYPWVSLHGLGNYISRCPGVGLIELDVRDLSTFVAVRDKLLTWSPAINAHLRLKMKVWKIIGATYNFKTLETDLDSLAAVGVNPLFVIMQGPDSPLGLESPEGEDDPVIIPKPAAGRDYDTVTTVPNSTTVYSSAKQLIADELEKNVRSGIEVSMPYGGSDPLWENVKLYLPDPCQYARPLKWFQGWKDYKTTWQTCKAASLKDINAQFSGPAIGGWIPIPEVANYDASPGVGDPALYPVNYPSFWPSDPLPGKDVSYAAQGFFDSKTGLCCFVPSASSMSEQETNYLWNAEAATVVVSDADPSAFFSGSGFNLSQEYFLKQ